MVADRQCLTTETVSQRDRFAYWRDLICDAYVHLGCDVDNPSSFKGEIDLRRLARSSASVVTSTPQHVQRRKSDIARSGDDSFLVSFQLEARGIVQQAGRLAALSPGDFALYSSTDPYDLHFDAPFQQLVVQVPRDVLAMRLPQADLLTGRAVRGDSAVGSLVATGMRQILAALEGASPLTQRFMEDTMVDLVVTGLATLDDGLQLRTPDRGLLLRARQEIGAQLADPEFDRAKLAAALGVSVRRLSEVFQAEGHTIAQTIRDTRLDRIAHDLVDPRWASLGVAEIATRWGMNNAAGVSRLFRARFGLSPRDFRQRGLPPRECTL